MSKFKEGDEIIVRQITRGYGFPGRVTGLVQVNDCGVITKVLDKDAYSVNITGKSIEFLYDEEMELYKKFIRNKKLEELGI